MERLWRFDVGARRCAVIVECSLRGRVAREMVIVGSRQPDLKPVRAVGFGINRPPAGGFELGVEFVADLPDGSRRGRLLGWGFEPECPLSYRVQRWRDRAVPVGGFSSGVAWLGLYSTRLSSRRS